MLPFKLIYSDAYYFRSANMFSPRKSIGAFTTV